MSTDDLRTARDRAAHASEFVFPVYRTVDGELELDNPLITVTTRGPVPDGRWTVEHGPFYCMADRTEDWIAFAPDFEDPGNYERTKESRRQWEAFLDKATFTSLDKAIQAAVSEQRKEQEQLDELARKEKS